MTAENSPPPLTGGAQGGGDGHLGERVLSETGIENGIRNLIAIFNCQLCHPNRRLEMRCTYAILSGWPSPTDSEVKRKLPWWVPFAKLPIVTVVDIDLTTQRNNQHSD